MPDFCMERCILLYSPLELHHFVGLSNILDSEGMKKFGRRGPMERDASVDCWSDFGGQLAAHQFDLHGGCVPLCRYALGCKDG